MKYLRKFVAFIFTIILLASLTIGIGFIFAVKNVNVTLLSYTYGENSKEANGEISDIKNSVLVEVRGSLISFVNEENVAEIVEKNGLILDEFKKIYPCTVNLTVRERRETFRVRNSDESYTIYDDGGYVLRRAATEEEALNAIDGAPDLLIEGAEDEADVKSVAKVCEYYRNSFLSLRSSIEKVVLTKGKSSIERDRIVLYLRSGISIEIQDYKTLTKEKVEAGYSKFSSLSPEDKLGGRIYCYVTEENEVGVTYNKNAK